MSKYRWSIPSRTETFEPPRFLVDAGKLEAGL
jgi:hypothetical protein